MRLYYNVDNAAALGLATVFAAICLPQIFFYGLYTILGQVLNAHGRLRRLHVGPRPGEHRRHHRPGLVPAGRVPHGRRPGRLDPRDDRVLAGSATLSIVVQAVSLLFPLRRIGFRYRPVWGIRGHGLGEVSTVAKWTFGSIVVSQLGSSSPRGC